MRITLGNIISEGQIFTQIPQKTEESAGGVTPPSPSFGLGNPYHCGSLTRYVTVAISGFSN